MKISFETNSIRHAPVKKIEKYIEIIGSSNPRLNALATESRLSIQTALSQKYTNVALSIVDNMADLRRLVAKKPDLVVLGMKLILLDPTKGYDDSPKMWLSTYLRDNNIAFTGSSKRALELGFHKHETKQRVLDAGLQTSAYFVSKVGNPSFKHNLNYPLFVKPTNRGGSKGIDEKSLVHTAVELKTKILSIHNECNSDALVEEYLPGREFSVAVMRRPNSNALFAMPIEIIAPADNKGNSFLSKGVKNADSEKVITVHDAALITALNTLAVNVFKALGARDYGRIDMRVDRHGIPSFIEANLMPGLSNHGYLSRCFYANKGINYTDMIQAIISLGLERIIRKPVIKTITLPSYLDKTAVNYLRILS